MNPFQTIINGFPQATADMLGVAGPLLLIPLGLIVVSVVAMLVVRLARGAS